MFTGLVEGIGRVRSLVRHGPSAKIFVALRPQDGLLEGAALGDSISVSGVCITVTRLASDGFEADLSAETLGVTTLGKLAAGSKVNLERATKANARLGGHIVLGHVDGVGEIVGWTQVGDATRAAIRAGHALAPFLAAKGSVAVEGVSLTVNDVTDSAAGCVFELMLIPHTLAATTLEDLRVGSPVNIEVDVLARYVARQLQVGRGPSHEVGLSEGAGRPHIPGRDDEGPHDADVRLLQKLKHGGWG